MSLGRRKTSCQPEFWIASSEVVQGPGHPFYSKLNEVLSKHGFDEFVEERCAPFYHESRGRPSIPPGVYFRMLLIGYFEGIDSERGIAWRCADSLGLRTFLGYALTERTPDHSSLSVIRRRIDLETHREVFVWVLKVLKQSGLLKGKTLGIDATTLEANAAMRSIVRRDTSDGYEDFLRKLAEESGVSSPTREELARLDKNRKKTTSNRDWKHPHDEDAKITKLKDGRTHLGYKAEHAVDLATGAVTAVTLQPGDRGDTASVGETLTEAQETLEEVAQPESDAGQMREAVLDKGYHSNDVCRHLTDSNIRSYISEPDRGRRKWKGKRAEQRAVYENRRRIRGDRGKRLLRKRAELVERSFAHCYDTGGMRRVHLRGRENVLKRLLIHVAGFNLGLAMRKMWGVGKPRSLQDGMRALLGFIFAVFRAVWSRIGPFAFDPPHSPFLPPADLSSPAPNHGVTISFRLSKKWVFFNGLLSQP